MKKPTNPRSITLVLVLLVLLPTLLYTAYELSSMRTSEQLLGEIYNRQLDAILFSVNQHAWDVAEGWAKSIANQWPASGKDSMQVFFVSRDAAIAAMFFADSTGNVSSLFSRGENTLGVSATELSRTLHANGDKLSRLFRYLSTGYRKLEPIYPSGEARKDVSVVFAIEGATRASIGGMVIDADAFSRSVISRKLQDAAGDEFVLAVLAGADSSAVFRTSPVQGELQQQKALWLFPNHMLAIGPKGATVADIVKERTYRNITLIGVLALVLLAGVWFVNRMIRKEMELVRLKSDFVSNVSHELRTPLALIRMFGETLEMGRVKSEEKKMEYYTTIVRESERLTGLVNNILDFSRMEAGKKRYNFRETDINAIISGVVSTYSYHLQDKGIAPVVDLSGSLPTINADPDALSEAIINLIDNAVKYGGDDKFLQIATGIVGADVVIEIEDHGIGIAEGDRKKIFDTFYRVSSGLVHATKGSGLGLSLVKHIVDAHGGRIELESMINKGSTFRILLPVRNSHTEAGLNT